MKPCCMAVNSQDLSRETANGGALALNMHSIESANSPHAQLFIDDDADLRLQTFTLERLVKTKNGNAKL